jgi:hypothetical protein
VILAVIGNSGEPGAMLWQGAPELLQNWYHLPWGNRRFFGQVKQLMMK